MTAAVAIHPPTRKRRERYACKVVQVRVATSFSAGDIDWLSRLIDQALRGADLRVLLRAKAGGAVSRKVAAMRKAVAAKQEQRSREDALRQRPSGLTLQETADALGVPAQVTVLRWVHEGKLPAVRHPKIGYRVQSDDVTAFAAEHAQRLAIAQGRALPRRRTR